VEKEDNVVVSELAVACRDLLSEQELDSRIGRVDQGIRLDDFHVLRDRSI
jgi:hypothetical protein